MSSIWQRTRTGCSGRPIACCAPAGAGRRALADIVTEVQLPDGIICDATLWAACIGGAMQVTKYVAAIERAGLRVETVRNNPGYQFISENAQGATRTYGVKSVSLLAVKA